MLVRMNTVRPGQRNKKSSSNSKFIDFHRLVQAWFPIAALQKCEFRVNIWNIQIFMGLLQVQNVAEMKWLRAHSHHAFLFVAYILIFFFAELELCDRLINSALPKLFTTKTTTTTKTKTVIPFNTKLYEYIFKIAFGLPLVCVHYVLAATYLHALTNNGVRGRFWALMKTPSKYVLCIFFFIIII